MGAAKANEAHCIANSDRYIEDVHFYQIKIYSNYNDGTQYILHNIPTSSTALNI